MQAHALRENSGYLQYALVGSVATGSAVTVAAVKFSDDVHACSNLRGVRETKTLEEGEEGEDLGFKRCELLCRMEKSLGCRETSCRCS
jgi:hypothetical protein